MTRRLQRPVTRIHRSIATRNFHYTAYRRCQYSATRSLQSRADFGGGLRRCQIHIGKDTVALTMVAIPLISLEATS